jgi:hypothetical protein
MAAFLREGFMPVYLCVFVELPDAVVWRTDWLWGLPLIVATAMIHVLGLGFINQRISRVCERISGEHHPMFAVVISATVLLATTLHALEATIWAVAYRLLGALGDFRSAILYSLNAMTTYGHINIYLTDRWHLLGALEALNGWLLFGLTTAFLFGIIDELWFGSRKSKRRAAAAAAAAH